MLVRRELACVVQHFSRRHGDSQDTGSDRLTARTPALRGSSVERFSPDVPVCALLFDRPFVEP